MFHYCTSKAVPLHSPQRPVGHPAPFGPEPASFEENLLRYSARHLNPTFLYGGFFNLNEVSRAK